MPGSVIPGFWDARFLGWVGGVGRLPLKCAAHLNGRGAFHEHPTKKALMMSMTSTHDEY